MERRKFLITSIIGIPLVSAGNSNINAIRDTKGFKVASGEGRFNESIILNATNKNILHVKVSSKDTDGDFTIFEQMGVTKGGPPLHVHHSQDEIFYVLEGEYQFQVGEDKYQLKAGDTIFLPRKVPHAFVRVSEAGRMLFAFQPAGQMEDFFKTVASLTAVPTPQEMAKIFEGHDMKVVGPPLKF